jgi:mannosyltransferase OCH1-like enzyme
MFRPLFFGKWNVEKGFRKMKIHLLWVLVALLTISCHKEKLDKKNKEDFNELMGASTSHWKFVETHEDYQNLYYFKEIYEKSKDLQKVPEEKVAIPHVIHFIWVGPNPFPQESFKNVASWVLHHPDWTIKFWTDRRRPLPHPKMELCLISDFQFEVLREYFEDSDNYAEKSDLLRYEILNQEGGVYVDHDVKCFKPFTSFHNHFDFYCGLEPPHEPVLSSSISVNNNLIGTVPRHPVMKKCIENVQERWSRIATAYPGDDKDSIIYRVAYRSFSSFDDAVRHIDTYKGFRNIVFPATYFNCIDDQLPLYAHHYYASTWFEDESKFERNVRRRLISISRKNNQILLFNAVILTANLFLFGCLVFLFRNLRRLMKKQA